jgi:LPS sulfotransferase NodH
MRTIEVELEVDLSYDRDGDLNDAEAFCFDPRLGMQDRLVKKWFKAAAIDEFTLTYEEAKERPMSVLRKIILEVGVEQRPNGEYDATCQNDVPNYVKAWAERVMIDEVSAETIQAKERKLAS